MRGAATLLLLTACAAEPEGHPEGARGTPVSAEEVRQVFVGTPWQGSSGTYLFRPDGTYTYQSDKTTTRWGPFKYTINPDGSVLGPSATLRFYRLGTAYRYHNSASGEFYLARPTPKG